MAGILAIHVPEAGIVNYRQVAQTLARAHSSGGWRDYYALRGLLLSENAHEVVVESSGGTFTADYIVGCAGLHSDRLDPPFR